MKSAASPEFQRAQIRKSINDQILDLKAKILSNGRFQEFAAAFLPTRFVAKRKARDLFNLCTGFVHSQILFACVELNLCDILQDEALTLEELQERLHLPADGAERLVRAAVALKLAGARSGGRFGLGEQGAALLGNPGAIAMIRHHRLLYADLADPVSLLRGESKPTRLSKFWAYAGAETPSGLSSRDVADYSALMRVSQPLVASDLLDAYPFYRHSCILDIGGGDGAFLIALAARQCRIKLMLFDLEPVAQSASASFAALGLGSRATAVAGDFRTDPLPRGADLVTLIRVLHDHDDHDAVQLLRAIRAVLPDSGTLVIAEPMSEARGVEMVGDAYFGFYLLAMGSGRPRSPRRITEMLATAGFADIRVSATRRPMLTGLIVAK